MTEQYIETVPLAESVSNVLMQMQPGREWYKERLDMAVEYIDRQNAEILALNAALVTKTAEYRKLAELFRDYLADPCGPMRLLAEFYLAKVGK